MKVKNRFVLPPMHTGFATEWGEVTDRLISYFIKKYTEDVGRKSEDEIVPAEGWK
jgi:2,4-dienoyl-CoA reductase-like NADH-dependent reductase (Old Yellow Enzyme family)